MSKIVDFLRARIREPSTWRGLVLLFGSAAALVGVVLDAAQIETLISVVLAVVGALGVVTPDRTETDKNEDAAQ